MLFLRPAVFEVLLHPVIISSQYVVINVDILLIARFLSAIYVGESELESFDEVRSNWGNKEACRSIEDDCHCAHVGNRVTIIAVDTEGSVDDFPEWTAK